MNENHSSGMTGPAVSIASITVTWNGASTIAEHLGALLHQSLPLSQMIVVDNASEDDTLCVIKNNFSAVRVLSLPENQGVGGGFSAGLEYAAEAGYDWFWLFDQDSIPAPTALEDLLSALDAIPERASEIGVLASLPLDPQSKTEHPGLLWRDRLVPVPKQDAQNPICFVDSVISSGSLIRREVIEKVGLPRQDFFMDFVDHEYNLRIRRQGYKIAVIRSSSLYHNLGESRRVRGLPWGRVRMHCAQPAWRHYYISRNETFTVWHLLGSARARLFVLLRMLKRTVNIVCFEEMRLAKIRTHLSGVWDGLKGDLGKRPPNLPKNWKSTREQRSHAREQEKRNKASVDTQP